MTTGELILFRWPTFSRPARASLALAILAGLPVLYALMGHSWSTPEPVVITGPTMGTTYRVSIAAANSLDVNELRSEIEAELDSLNEQMSTYRESSEIVRINASRSGDWLDVSPQFARVVAIASKINRQSNGGFDPTIAPLVNRWNFGPGKRLALPPDRSEIELLRESVGMRRLQVRMAPPTLRKLRADVQLDLSAIAKGFAVDRLGELLESHEIEHFLIEIGGEVLVRGENSSGELWTIGIEKPVAHQRELYRAVGLRDAAMATSGDYRNFVEIEGKRFSHVIDPRTGVPVSHHLASVSVIADNCATADAWATALLVLGPKDGFALAEQRGLAALFVERIESRMISRSTTEFDRRTAPHDSRKASAGTR